MDVPGLFVANFQVMKLAQLHNVDFAFLIFCGWNLHKRS